MKFPFSLVLLGVAGMLAGCSTAKLEKSQPAAKNDPAPVFFKSDAGTAGVLKGVVQFTGNKPTRKPVDLSGDPACLEAHRGRAYDESLVVNRQDRLGNVFVYVKAGLEGKTFEIPKESVNIDQRGCWFRPRVLGLQVGQALQVTNSDPVTHNIHPLAQINREWNHSQASGDAPLSRKFLKPEIMVSVKCNIHSWMRAFIGVVPHPYFAVTRVDGTFEMLNLPAGDYVVAAWHEKLGTQERQVTLAASGTTEISFKFKGE